MALMPSSFLSFGSAFRAPLGLFSSHCIFTPASWPEAPSSVVGAACAARRLWRPADAVVAAGARLTDFVPRSRRSGLPCVRLVGASSLPGRPRPSRRMGAAWGRPLWASCEAGFPWAVWWGLGRCRGWGRLVRFVFISAPVVGHGWGVSGGYGGGLFVAERL